MDAVPQWEIDEITDRIELLSILPPVAAAAPMSDHALNMLLTNFEDTLSKLNQSLLKETRKSRVTIRDLSSECEKTKESVVGLNTELGCVIRK